MTFYKFAAEAQIIATGAAGLLATEVTELPHPDELVTIVHLVLQVIIAGVTAWAAIRKATQVDPTKPQPPTQNV